MQFVLVDHIFYHHQNLAEVYLHLLVKENICNGNGAGPSPGHVCLTKASNTYWLIFGSDVTQFGTTNWSGPCLEWLFFCCGYMCCWRLLWSFLWHLPGSLSEVTGFRFSPFHWGSFGESQWSPSKMERTSGLFALITNLGDVLLMAAMKFFMASYKDQSFVCTQFTVFEQH